MVTSQPSLATSSPFSDLQQVASHSAPSACFPRSSPLLFSRDIHSSWSALVLLFFQHTWELLAKRKHSMSGLVLTLLTSSRSQDKLWQMILKEEVTDSVKPSSVSTMLMLILNLMTPVLMSLNPIIFWSNLAHLVFLMGLSFHSFLLIFCRTCT